MAVQIAEIKSDPGQVRPSFLERFFAKYEFHCRHMLSCSDSESWQAKELLELADETTRHRWEEASLGYTESLGDPQLLQAIWLHYAERAQREAARRGVVAAWHTDAEEQSLIRLTTCIPVEGIYSAMTQLLSPGDHVVCMAPAYQALYEIARSRGCRLHSWKPCFDEEACHWRFDVADLQKLLEPFGTCEGQLRLRMLVMNFPHNPTGACLSESQFNNVAELLDALADGTERPILFSDEMYSDILPSRPSAVAKPSSIVLSGLSKPWGMPGLRLGWLLVENQYHFQRIAAFRDYTTLCLPAHTEILGLVALRNSAHFLDRNRKIASSNYAMLQAFLLRNERWFYPLNQHEHNQEVSGHEWTAAMVFVRLKSPLGGYTDVPAHLTSMTIFVEYLAQEHSICIVPGDFFEFEEFPCVRFGIGRESFKTALTHLERALNAV